jgi:hypothetical protein
MPEFLPRVYASRRHPPGLVHLPLPPPDLAEEARIKTPPGCDARDTLLAHALHDVSGLTVTSLADRKQVVHAVSGASWSQAKHRPLTGGSVDVSEECPLLESFCDSIAFSDAQSRCDPSSLNDAPCEPVIF